MNNIIAKYGDLEFDASPNWEPVQITQKWYYMISLPFAKYSSSTYSVW